MISNQDPVNIEQIGNVLKSIISPDELYKLSSELLTENEFKYL